MPMDRICWEMPKVELHAHLNGSISDQTCLQLLEQHKKDGKLNEELISLTDECNLSKCFEKFAQIHRLIQTAEQLKFITLEVIRNFASENVIYLELRTTPKAVHQISSKSVYIENVVKGILEAQKELPIAVKLLLSIDRKMGYDDGNENIDLALEWSNQYPEIVVGVDLSGDPTKGSTNWILKLLSKAKASNLMITCHLPEVRNYEEAREFLEFCPDRVGHGLYLHPHHGGSEELWLLLKKQNIPMEICISSNIIAEIVYDKEKHHVKEFYAEKLPHVICTDDCGIFNTTLSKEYLKYLKAVGEMSLTELKQLCLSTIDYSFTNPKEKCDLKQIMENWWNQELRTEN